MALGNILNEGSGLFDFENSFGKTQNDIKEVIRGL